MDSPQSKVTLARVNLSTPPGVTPIIPIEILPVLVELNANNQVDHMTGPDSSMAHQSSTHTRRVSNEVPSGADPDVQAGVGWEHRSNPQEWHPIDIAHHCAEAFGCTLADLLGPRRTRRYAQSRQMAAFMIRRVLPHWTIRKVADAFAWKHTSSLIYHYTTASRLVIEDGSFAIKAWKLEEHFTREKKTQPPPADHDRR